MDQRGAFLQSILETPDDDAPRLVFADWLEDEGDEARAEFIRAQIALERMRADDPRRPELEGRERVLLHAHGWDWVEALEVTEWRYRRGFIEYVEMPTDDADRTARTMAKAPIRHIRDVDRTDDLGDVVRALPHLRNLLSLEFWNLDGFRDEDVATILASPHLKDLQTLILHQGRNGQLIDERVLIDAMHSPLRRNLRELGVNIDGMDGGPSVATILAVAGSDHLENLRTLHLCHAGSETRPAFLPPEAIRELADSTNFARLEELNFIGVRTTADGWEELLTAPFARQLKKLWLNHAEIAGEPPTLLRNSSFRQRFESLGCEVDWWSEFWGEWEAGRWRGLTREMGQRERLHLMAPYLASRDATGLETTYRGWSLRSGETPSAAEAVPLSEFERSMQSAIRAALETDEVIGAFALRVGSDEWIARLAVQDEDFDGETPANEPREFFHTGTEVERWRLQGVRREREPAEQYLFARIAAAFVRCLDGCPLPAYFIPDQTVFRIGAGR